MNLWDIKNRWLRAAVAWLFAAITVVLVVVLGTIAALGGAAIGAFQELRALIGTADDWELPRLWAAMTAREKP